MNASAGACGQRRPPVWRARRSIGSIPENGPRAGQTKSMKHAVSINRFSGKILLNAAHLPMCGVALPLMVLAAVRYSLKINNLPVYCTAIGDPTMTGRAPRRRCASCRRRDYRPDTTCAAGELITPRRHLRRCARNRRIKAMTSTQAISH